MKSFNFDALDWGRLNIFQELCLSLEIYLSPSGQQFISVPEQ